MSAHRGPVRRLAPTALFLASIPTLAYAAQHTTGHAGDVLLVVLVLAVIALGVRALWWLGVDGRRPDIGRIADDRMSARTARR